MKHLYNLNSNTSLLSRNPNQVDFNNLQTKSKKDRCFDLLYALSMIESESDLEPSDVLIEYLLNYSKSLDVHHLSNSNGVCVFNKN